MTENFNSFSCELCGDFSALKSWIAVVVHFTDVKHFCIPKSVFISECQHALSVLCKESYRLQSGIIWKMLTFYRCRKETTSCHWQFQQSAIKLLHKPKEKRGRNMDPTFLFDNKLIKKILKWVRLSLTLWLLEVVTTWSSHMIINEIQSERNFTAQEL